MTPTEATALNDAEMSLHYGASELERAAQFLAGREQAGRLRDLARQAREVADACRELFNSAANVLRQHEADEGIPF